MRQCDLGDECMVMNGMELTLSWTAIGIRLLLASLFSLVIGLNRDEKGHPAGMRTTMLVCLAATLAQLQANLLLATAGKTPSSFGILDLERLPLGILSGIGFIGAGVSSSGRTTPSVASLPPLPSGSSRSWGYCSAVVKYDSASPQGCWLSPFSGGSGGLKTFFIGGTLPF